MIRETEKIDNLRNDTRLMWLYTVSSSLHFGPIPMMDDHATGAVDKSCTYIGSRFIDYAPAISPQRSISLDNTMDTMAHVCLPAD